MDYMVEIRAALVAIISALGGFFFPVTDFMVAILILLGVNFLSGWIEDEIHGQGWKWRKAFKTFYECLVMVGIGACVFTIGHFMHKDTAAVQCLSVIYLAAMWFYAVNILNNWKKILPEGSTLYIFVSFLHFTISLKFVEKIPYLKEFMDANKANTQHKIQKLFEEIQKEDNNGTGMENRQGV
ncbi:hypothetical protein [Prevotella sp. E2-28]|uniref:hypothetical protein n=1 Tax=Prevotella sp. E2-28 TaxID=2913620 RepID=UPI001EDBE220|nr:hypothetical protein [Prevotella sp. E2-28]UKK52652.1 hypothetical protein L6465_08540 [Prevotella sp. E2-28]